MTRPRSALISLADTPWYHVVNRCVRRAFLCGHDAHTGQNFEHRRGWVETRIRELSSVFAIDVAAYAVMSNHYHIVLRVDAERNRAWSDEDVLRRWTQLFTGPLLVQRYLLPAMRAVMGEAELAKVHEMADTYRARLFDLSWYMRVLNESIARQSNAEDGVKGHFWEGRFKSQALLDEQALLAAMAYVDLNPVRAGMAETLEDSAHTSIAARLGDLRGQPFVAVNAPLVPAQKLTAQGSKKTHATAQGATLLPSLLPEQVLAALPEAPLMPFDPTGRFAQGVPFGLEEYLDLVDTVGRVVHPKKRGTLAHRVPPLLQRLGMDAEAFVACADTFFRTFAHAVGTPASLIKLASARQCRAMRGMSVARRMLHTVKGDEGVEIQAA